MGAPKNYEKCCIYKLVCRDLAITDCYVGHTTNFNQRKSEHHRNSKTESRKEYGYHVYERIRETGGWKNWEMLAVEWGGFENKYAAVLRERDWIEKLSAKLNMRRAVVTDAEYKADREKRYLLSIKTSSQPENILEEGKSINMNECGSV